MANKSPVSPLLKLLRLLLLPFALLYSTIMLIRNYLYDKGIFKIYEPSVPVISVGNISMGGTGKTPMAEYLLAKLSHDGHKPAYLSRGYGRKTKGYRKIDLKKAKASLVGDEALQVARKFPGLAVAVSENRAIGIQRLIQEHQADYIILDDAFQHRKVNRHFNLLMIDAAHMPYTDWVFPAGSLRESISGIKRADALIINKVKNPELIPQFKAKLEKWDKPMAFCTPVHQAPKHWQESQELDLPLREVQAMVFAGLGNNHFFLEQIKKKGVIVPGHLFFPDHYDYKIRDLEAIRLEWEKINRNVSQKPAIILTTEKDICRLLGTDIIDEYKELPIYYLPMHFHWWEGEEKLLHLINQKIQSSLWQI